VFATDSLFDERLPDRNARLTNLYEKSKRDFWNETTDIDWDRELRLSSEKRRVLAQLLSNTYYGERAALTVAAQLIPMVRDEEARQALACQVIEEAKHVAVFQRLLRRIDRIHKPSFFTKRLLVGLTKEKDPVAKMIGMHLFIENVANQSFTTLRENIDDPLIEQVLEYVARDEKKHTAIATLYLPELLEDVSAARATVLKAKQVRYLANGVAMVKDGVAVARLLDIDLSKAGQRALKEHYRLRDQMPSKRALLDVPGFDRVIDEIAKYVKNSKTE
jgi:rubrerythrin